MYEKQSHFMFHVEHHQASEIVMGNTVFKLCFLTGFLCHFVLTQLHTNFEVSRVAACGPNKDPIHLRHINVTKQDGRQFLNFDLRTRIPLDDQVGVNFLIKYPVNGNFVQLFTIDSNSACKTANKYMGEFWYDIERAALIPVGVCPILAGHYYVHHHWMNFGRISLQTFPFGKLQFTLKWIDNKTRTTLLCLIMEVENMIE